MLVLLRAPVVLEPVDEHLEGNMIGSVEVEALWSDLDELLQHFLLRHVTKHDVLWVRLQDGKTVGDSTRLLFFLLL